MQPGATQSVDYKIKPKTVGPLSIGQTSVSVPGWKFFSNPLNIGVACSTGTACDDSIGETPFTCPNKCGSSPNEELPAAPESNLIPTPEYKPPADPKAVVTEQEQKSAEKEKSDLNTVYIGGAVLLIALAAAYFLFFKPKPKKK